MNPSLYVAFTDFLLDTPGTGAQSTRGYPHLPFPAFFLMVTKSVFSGPGPFRFARRTNMRIVSKWILVSGVVSLAVLLSITFGLPVVQGSADHVRWDIIHF